MHVRTVLLALIALSLVADQAAAARTTPTVVAGPVDVRRRSVRRSRECALRLHARSAWKEHLLGRLCRGLAPVCRQRQGSSRRGNPRRPGRDRDARRQAAAHIRRQAALLLHRRPQARTDPVPERRRIRRTLARGSPLRRSGSLAARPDRDTRPCRGTEADAGGHGSRPTSVKAPRRRQPSSRVRLAHPPPSVPSRRRTARHSRSAGRSSRRSADAADQPAACLRASSPGCPRV